MVNISAVQLTDILQNKLLSKGLSFCPVYDTNWFKLVIDLYNFFRQLRLKSFFPLHPDLSATTNVDGTVLTGRTLGLCGKSTFSPPQDNSVIEAYIQLVHMEITDLRRSEYQGHISNNMTKSEKEALIELIDSRSITIKPADKNGTLVVMDTAAYIEEIYGQL